VSASGSGPCPKFEFICTWSKRSSGLIWRDRAPINLEPCHRSASTCASRTLCTVAMNVITVPALGLVGPKPEAVSKRSGVGTCAFAGFMNANPRKNKMLAKSIRAPRRYFFRSVMLSCIIYDAQGLSNPERRGFLRGEWVGYCFGEAIVLLFGAED